MLSGHEKYGESGPGDNCCNNNNEVFKLVIIWRAENKVSHSQAGPRAGWESEPWISRDNSTLSDLSSSHSKTDDLLFVFP